MPKSEPKLRPLNDRLIVRIDKPKDRTEGGLYIPDTAKDKPTRGEVLAVGPGKRNDLGDRITMDVKVGNIVMFTTWAGSDVKELGDDIRILSESDVLCVVE